MKNLVALFLLAIPLLSSCYVQEDYYDPGYYPPPPPPPVIVRPYPARPYYQEYRPAPRGRVYHGHVQGAPVGPRTQMGMQPQSNVHGHPSTMNGNSNVHGHPGTMSGNASANVHGHSNSVPVQGNVHGHEEAAKKNVHGHDDELKEVQTAHNNPAHLPPAVDTHTHP